MDLQSFLTAFHEISETDFTLLQSQLVTKTYRKGELITQEGQVQKELLFVNKGAQMSFYEKANKQHVIAFTYPPGFTGIPESFLFQEPAKYNLQALTESEFSAISFQKLNRLFDQSQQLERLFRKISETVLAGLLQRHIELLAYPMEERFRTFASRSPHLFQLVPHKYIASYLNIDPTNFSKLYNSIRI